MDTKDTRLETLCLNEVRRVSGGTTAVIESVQEAGLLAQFTVWLHSFGDNPTSLPAPPTSGIRG